MNGLLPGQPVEAGRPPAPSLYVVFTRYQLKLAMAHRRRYGSIAPAVLACHGRVRLRGEARELFSKRLVFDASTGVRSPANPTCFRKLCRELDDLIASTPASQRVTLLVASAAYPVSNWLLVRYQGQVHAAMLADGLSAYLPLDTPWQERTVALGRKAYARLRFGMSASTLFRHPHGLDSNLVSAIYAEWPEIMPAHGKPVHALPPAFEAPRLEALLKPRDSVWFLGQPHLYGTPDLRKHLTALAEALRADHPQATRFVYKCHHFEPSALQPLLAELGFEPDLRPDCAEELLCVEVPLAVYSYRSTALLALRNVLPPEVAVISFAPWLVRPPGERLVSGSIEGWMRRFGVSRPAAGSRMRALESGLGVAANEWPATEPLEPAGGRPSRFPPDPQGR